MIRPAPKKTAMASPVWPSFDSASPTVPSARTRCTGAEIIRPPEARGRALPSRAGPSAVDVRADLRGAPALAEPGGHRLPLLAGADRGRHQVGGVEPEGGVRVGEVLGGQLVDRVGVEGLVHALVRRDPA